MTSVRSPSGQEAERKSWRLGQGHEIARLRNYLPIDSRRVDSKVGFIFQNGGAASIVMADFGKKFRVDRLRQVGLLRKMSFWYRARGGLAEMGIGTVAGGRVQLEKILHPKLGFYERRGK